MESLPSELFAMILEYLGIKDLGNCTIVQKRFNAIAKQVMLNQSTKLGTKLDTEVRRELCWLAKEPDETDQMMSSLDLILSVEEMKSLFIWQLYQNTLFDPSTNITIEVKSIATVTNSNTSTNQPTSSKDASAGPEPALSPLQETFFKCLNRRSSAFSFHRPPLFQHLPVDKVNFMSCHNILVMPCPERQKSKRFFVMAKQPKWEPKVEYIDVEPDKEWRWEEYGILFKNLFYVDWEKISVYGDTILVEKPRKHFDLLKITEVNHSLKKITMNREEEIAVEVVAKDFINFNGRIFILVLNDTTFLVMRDNAEKRQKRIEILEHPSLVPCFGRKFCRMNNLIFIAVTPNHPIPILYKDQARSWLIFDGNAADPVVHTVNVTSLVRSLVLLTGHGPGTSGCSCTPPCWRVCRFVESVSCFNNLFIAVYGYYLRPDFTEQPHLDEANQNRRILVAPMKRAPKLEDFFSFEAFSTLFSERSYTEEFVGQVSPPFYYPGFTKGVSILGGRGGTNSVYQFSTN